VAVEAVLIVVPLSTREPPSYARGQFRSIFSVHGEWPIFTARARHGGNRAAPFDGVWSLGIEEKFYVFADTGVVLLERRRGRGSLP